MVVVYQVQEPLQQVLTFLLCHAVNVRYVSADREDALPSGDGVGSNYGMNSLELTSNVLWSSARLVVELEPLAFSNGVKVRLLKGCRERFKELLVRFADSIVDFVSRCPKGV